MPGFVQNIAISTATVFVLAVFLVPSAQAQMYNVIYNFTGGQDGRNPLAGLSIDKAGNLYGTTALGGSSDGGTVFKLSHKGAGWIFSPLHSFTGGNDGAEPYARVVFGPDGSLYGTTNAAGDSGCYLGQGCGTVFNLRPPPRACKTALCPWTETVLYRFAGGSDGGNPWSADLVFDQEGNLYGTTRYGGMQTCPGPKSCGVVYELTPSNGGWTESVLYSFTGGNDGGIPGGGVILDQGRNLYGVTSQFGPTGQGTVYELTSSGSGWTANTIYDFEREYGAGAVGSLVFDVYGNLLGATYGDILNPPWYPGTLYEITKSGITWTGEWSYDFSGEYPNAGLTPDAGGNLYGSAVGNSELGSYGLVYKLVPSNGGWNFADLHDFTDGSNPNGGIVTDAGGNTYGTTQNGGAYGYGVVWEITP